MNDEDIRKATATALRSMRSSRGLTQSEAARRVGVPQPNLSRWESGKVTPSLGNIYALASAYEVSPADLIPSPEDIERARGMLRGPGEEA